MSFKNNILKKKKKKIRPTDPTILRASMDKQTIFILGLTWSK